MRRAGAAVPAVLALAACTPVPYADLPISAYRGFGDRLKAYFSPFFGRPCGARLPFASGGRARVDDCLRLTAPRAMRGVIVTIDYGPSWFYENASEVPRSYTHGRMIVSQRYRLRGPVPDQATFRAQRRGFAIRFIGRETVDSAAPRGIVTVDRVEAVRRLPVPPSAD